MSETHGRYRIVVKGGIMHLVTVILCVGNWICDIPKFANYFAGVNTSPVSANFIVAAALTLILIWG